MILVRITSVTVTPKTTTVGQTVTVVATVYDNQGFITADKLLLYTKNGEMVLVKDS